MRTRTLVLTSVIALLVATVTAALIVADAAPVGAAVRYRPPVVAPVIDPFGSPPTRYAAGNRGLDYGTRPGQAIAAIGDGTVVFAGQVARRNFVTVRHPDGLRSSYSWLATISVAVGDRVRVGDLVGTAGARFQLGVRRGSDYLDPAGLFGRRRARLVPAATVRRSTTAPRS